MHNEKNKKSYNARLNQEQEPCRTQAVQCLQRAFASVVNNDDELTPCNVGLLRSGLVSDDLVSAAVG